MVPTPCVACIFLYPYSQMEARKRALGASRGEAQKGVWFMQQQVSNACGAVAIMHAVRRRGGGQWGGVPGVQGTGLGREGVNRRSAPVPCCPKKKNPTDPLSPRAPQADSRSPAPAHPTPAGPRLAPPPQVMNNLDRIGEGSAFLAGFRDQCAGATAAERAELFAPAMRQIHESHAAAGQTDAPTPTAELDFHFVVRGGAKKEKRAVNLIHTTPSAPMRTPRERTPPQATPRPPPAAIGPHDSPLPRADVCAGRRSRVRVGREQRRAS